MAHATNRNFVIDLTTAAFKLKLRPRKLAQPTGQQLGQTGAVQIFGLVVGSKISPASWLARQTRSNRQHKRHDQP